MKSIDDADIAQKLRKAKLIHSDVEKFITHCEELLSIPSMDTANAVAVLALDKVSEYISSELNAANTAIAFWGDSSLDCSRGNELRIRLDSIIVSINRHSLLNSKASDITLIH